jgi:hypothetical protein
VATRRHTMRCATLMTLGKYRINGRNRSWISHTRTAVDEATRRPKLAAMMGMVERERDTRKIDDVVGDATTGRQGMEEWREWPSQQRKHSRHFPASP